MDSCKLLLYAVIALATVHAILSTLILLLDNKMSATQKKGFLVISVVVNLAIVIIAVACLLKSK